MYNILYYNQLRYLYTVEKPTQLYDYFTIFSGRTSKEILKLDSYLIVNNTGLLKYHIKYRNKLNFLCICNDTFNYTNINIQVYDYLAKQDLHWVGTFEEDINTFYINPYYLNKDIISFVILTLQGK